MDKITKNVSCGVMMGAQKLSQEEFAESAQQDLCLGFRSSLDLCSLDDYGNRGQQKLL